MDSTSSGLLSRARDGDPDSWNVLVGRYGPLVFGWVRSSGVSRTDAGDVVQEVFAGLVRMLPEYEHQSFRGWLRILTRNKVSDYFRRHGKQPVAHGGSSFVGFLHSVAGLTNLDHESTLVGEESQEGDLTHNLAGLSYQESARFQEIVDAVRSRTSEASWQIFWSVVVDDRFPEDVATELGVKIGTVYQCVSRTLARLRKELKANGL